MKRNRILSFLLVVIMALLAFQTQAQSAEINLENFDAEISGGRVLINWSITDVDAGNYFEIEKSLDGKNFKTIAYVLGPDPSKEGNHFGYFDRFDKKSGKAYYRIKHVSVSGELHFSNARVVASK